MRLEVDRNVLVRSHALTLMIFSGLASLPTHLLAEAAASPPGALTPDRRSAHEHAAAQRAGIARYVLDVLARSEPRG